jgi:hypothetical protein
VAQLTWNLDSGSPAALDASGSVEDSGFFGDLLFPDFPVVPHLLVVGFQELINLESSSMAAKSLFNGSKTHESLLLWAERIARALATHLPAWSYTAMEPRQLVGLGQLVFIRADLHPSCSFLRTEVVKTGLGGYHGNKGAILTRLSIMDTSFCFVNCHLAAHQTNVSARNADIVNILRDASFPALQERVQARFVQGGDGGLLMVGRGGGVFCCALLKRACVHARVHAAGEALTCRIPSHPPPPRTANRTTM